MEATKTSMESILAKVATADPKAKYDRLLNLARTAEASERYPDMCRFMRTLVNDKCAASEDLQVEERNLLSVAYKNVVGSKRSSWRTLNSGNIESSDPELTKQYKNTVETELRDICNEVILLLGVDMKANEANAADSDAWKAEIAKYQKNTLLSSMDNDKPPQSETDCETVVFYLKMVGDYCRYLAEIDDVQSRAYTMHFYKKAYEYAKGIKDGKGLAETHPTRLGLALNYSVCHYEIMKQPDKACALAKVAFDGAIEKLDTLNDASYKDSTLIMQLLRDNLTLWTSEGQQDGGDEEDNP